MSQQVKRILIVDDDDDVLESTRSVLHEHGYDVMVARDGAQALASAERDAPDLIVLDVVMPLRSGFAVLQRLKQRASRAPRIVVVTGNVEDRFRQIAESAGADAFLHKPFDLDELIQTIAHLLEEP